MRPRALSCPLALALGLLLAGCGSDDDGDGGAGPGTQSSASSGGGGDPGSGGTGAAGGSGGSGTGATGGSVPGCDTLARGPLTPEPVIDLLDGSEDFAFDGKGHAVGKQGAKIVLVDANEMVTDLADVPEQVYGLRYHQDGDLIAAYPGQGRLVRITPEGVVTDWVSGLAGPNGIYPDFDGNVWVTEFGGSKVTRVASDGQKTEIVTGGSAQAANGIVLDPSKTMLFYTEYQEGKIHRVDLDAAEPMPVEILTILDAKLDGLVLDACGNLYAVDQANSRLYRLPLDAEGAPAGSPQLLATFPENVANAQFGSGDGFDPNKLYAAGVPGTVFSVEIGVPGAPVPTPP
jgi:sugar lactone lactonase YvrE